MTQRPPEPTAADPAPAATPAPATGPNRLLRGAAAVLVGLCVAAWIQSGASGDDYQNAFFATAIVGVLTAATVFYQATRAAARRGHPWLIPGVIVSALAVAAVLFRFEHFSGEMVPQFAWRFARDAAPAPQTAPKQSSEIATSDFSAAGEPGDFDAPWPGLLGPDRDGVLPTREFDVPGSPDEIETSWEIGVGEGWSSFAVAGDLAITLEQRGSREAVSAYDLDTGELRWIVEHEARHENALGGIGPRSTPTIDRGRVYAQGATGWVWCIDLATGQTVWTADLLALAGWTQVASETAILWGRAGSPLVVGDVVVVPFGGPEVLTDRSLIGLNVRDGTTRWTAGADQISYASPVRMTLASVDQIVSVNEATLTGHAIDDGTVLWSTPFEGQSNGGANCASAVPAGSDRFLVGKGYGGGSQLVQINAGPDGSLTPAAIWSSTRVLKTKFNHAVVVDGVAYALSNGTLEAVRVEDAERLWRQSRGDRFGQGQAIAAGDCLIVQAETGEVAFVDADRQDYRLRCLAPALTSKTWNIPTLAGRRLLVRNNRRAMALQLPERSSWSP